MPQEFAFPDVVVLWDALLSDPGGRADCLLRLCCAMLLHLRELLIQARPGTARGLGSTSKERASAGVRLPPGPPAVTAYA